MEQSQVTELKQLLDEAMLAPTKQDALRSITRMEFLASQLRSSIDPYLSMKLQEAIGYAQQASGRVKEKEHWVSCAKQSWYVFENGINHAI